VRPTSGVNPVNAPEAAKPAGYEHTFIPSESEKAGDEKPTSKRDEHPAKASTTVVEAQQSSPYVTESDSVKRTSYSPPPVDVVGTFSTKESGASRDAPRKISEGDLQDVLTAAQNAADSAERAAAAARSAASLAQLRINELTKKTPDQSPESPNDNPFHSNPPQTMENRQFDHQDSSVSSYGDLTDFHSNPPQTMEKPQFDHQTSSVSSYGDLTDFQMADTASSLFSHERNNHQAERFPSLGRPRFDHQNSSGSSYGNLTELQRPEISSVSSYGNLTELQRPETSSFDRRSPDHDHQQMRLPSMEDDPYYSYPNLFTSQKPDLSHSFSDNTKPAHDS
jgi:vacuolar protein sorting-associated protein IST1